MKSDAHTATVKTLRQVLQIMDANPKFLREYLETRLEDLGETAPHKPAGKKTRKQNGESSKPADAGEKAADRMPPHWCKMLAFIGDQKEASLDDLLDYAVKEKLPITKTKDVLRSQMAEYAKPARGLVNRIRPGVFELTETGKKRIGYDLV